MSIRLSLGSDKNLQDLQVMDISNLFWTFYLDQATHGQSSSEEFVNSQEFLHVATLVFIKWVSPDLLSSIFFILFVTWCETLRYKCKVH
jgi:hypothetical protein